MPVKIPLQSLLESSGCLWRDKGRHNDPEEFGSTDQKFVLDSGMYRRPLVLLFKEGCDMKKDQGGELLREVRQLR